MDRINVNNFDVSAFSEVLASCKGDVYMVTPEGDPNYSRNPVYEFDVVAGFCL